MSEPEVKLTGSPSTADVVGPVQITFVSGPPVCTDLIFGGLNGVPEHLRFREDGVVLVQGRVAAHDLEVVNAVRRWMGMPPKDSVDPKLTAARMLDRLSFRKTVWDSPLWSPPRGGPCALLGRGDDEIDPQLVAIRWNLSMDPAARRDPHEAFADRALEIDTSCAQAARAVVCDYARAAQELRYGRLFFRAFQRCSRCKCEHQDAVMR